MSDLAADLLLNVDDHEPGRYARTRLLSLAGFRVREAASGTQALVEASQHRPALILLDVNLPDISGLEVCRRLRSDPKMASIPVLQISASSVGNAHHVAGLNNGADSYLIEPVDPEVLIANVRALLRMRRAEEELMVINEKLTESNAALGSANAALRMREQELVGANRELEQFAYAASHDLQEPLRTITAYTQLLLRKNVDRLHDESAIFAEHITKATSRMQDLIGDILTYSRSVHAEVPETLANLNSALQSAELNLSQALTESGGKLASDDLPVVRGDETQLAAVFQNLISNSLKYRDRQRAPVINVGARQNDGQWEFAISDNGIGFEQRYADRIFGLFKRLHTTDAYSGTGVGLSIVKKVVERHGGRVWAEGRPGCGATFYFTLPLLVEN